VTCYPGQPNTERPRTAGRLGCLAKRLEIG
jgi:hypothetical protein